MVSYASLCKWPGNLSQSVKPYVVIISCFVLNLIFGSYISFGNFLPYIVSYVRVRSSPQDLHLTNSAFIFAIQAIGVGCTVILGNILDKYFAPRLVVICGGLLVFCGVAVSYFTIQYSYWLFILSYGVLYGIGSGLSYVSIVTCAVKWMPPRWKGLTSGFVLSGTGISPFIINPIQTGFVNPGNVSPSSYSPLTNELYFTQSEVLDRVPILFIVLGLFYISVIGIACVFIALPRHPEEASDSIDNSKGDDNRDTPLTSLCEDSKPRKETDMEKPDNNITCVEMLKKPKFYHISIAFVLCVGVNSFVLALYKSFGFEEVTSNDHFLTAVGSICAVFNLIGHIVWGLLADIVDYKLAMIVQSGYITIVILTLYSTTVVGKIMYCIWLCGLFFGIGGYFSIFSVAVAKNFGPKHLSTNYGIMMGVGFVFGSLLSSGMSFLHYDIQWYGNLLVLGGLSCIELILALLLHVYKTNKEL